MNTMLIIYNYNNYNNNNIIIITHIDTDFTQTVPSQNIFGNKNALILLNPPSLCDFFHEFPGQVEEFSEPSASYVASFTRKLNNFRHSLILQPLLHTAEWKMLPKALHHQYHYVNKVSYIRRHKGLVHHGSTLESMQKKGTSAAALKRQNLLSSSCQRFRANTLCFKMTSMISDHIKPCVSRLKTGHFVV